MRSPTIPGYFLESNRDESSRCLRLLSTDKRCFVMGRFDDGIQDECNYHASDEGLYRHSENVEASTTLYNDEKLLVA